MESAYYITLLFSFVVGSAVGSFLNVCIARIPGRESIVFPPSRCPRCLSRIRAYDNIPIVSYLFLRGICRSCGERIPFRYPLVETVTALLSMALFMRFGLTFSYLVYFAFLCALVVVTFIDLDHRIIPDVVSLPGIVLGFVLSFLSAEIGWMDSAIGIIMGGGLLLLVAVVYVSLTGEEGMGGGDVKLLAMIGAFVGWKGVLFVIMVSSLLGTVIGGTIMLFSGKGRRFAIPFGPFLSLGALIYLFWGEALIGWYLSSFAGAAI